MLGAGAIDALRVTHVQGLQDILQAVFGRRDEDQVNVIGHQAIAGNRDAMFSGILPQPREIGLAVRVIKEHVLAPVPALGDVVRHLGKNRTGNAGHDAHIAQRGRQNKG